MLQFSMSAVVPPAMEAIKVSDQMHVINYKWEFYILRKLSLGVFKTPFVFSVTLELLLILAGPL